MTSQVAAVTLLLKYVRHDKLQAVDSQIVGIVSFELSARKSSKSVGEMPFCDSENEKRTTGGASVCDHRLISFILPG